jgi:hypothetical protein
MLAFLALSLRIAVVDWLCMHPASALLERRRKPYI